MRERVGHGEGGRRATDIRAAESPAAESPAAESWAAGGWGLPSGMWSARRRCERARVGAWRVGRRRGRGPQPARPGIVAVAVRPAEVSRPVHRGARPLERWWPSAAPRVLVRRSVVRRDVRHGLRRAVGSVALVVASAAAVVALGLLARVAEPGPVSDGRVAAAPAALRGPAPVVTTVEPGETVWEVVDRVVPGLSGPERAALAERIVVDNGLPSVRPEPGRVLRVAAGQPRGVAPDRSSPDPAQHAA